MASPRRYGSQDHEQAAWIAEGLRPATRPHRSRQADYWITYGRALTRIRGRHDQAVMALRRAELILPHYVQRDSITRDVIAVLLAHFQRERERGRLQAEGNRTDDDSLCTLLIIHETDGSWAIHGLGAPGVRLPAAKREC